MLCYFKRKNPHNKLVVLSVVPSLSGNKVQRVNEGVKHSMKQEASDKKCVKYNEYSAKERAQISKYAAEDRATCGVRHFSKVLDRNVLETTARSLKAEYLAALKSRASEKEPHFLWWSAYMYLKRLGGGLCFLGRILTHLFRTISMP